MTTATLFFLLFNLVWGIMVMLMELPSQQTQSRKAFTVMPVSLIADDFKSGEVDNHY